jgi:hypothetical protein
MIISATEFKTNLGKYLALAAQQDIFIMKNGKSIAKLTSPTTDKIAALDSLVGIIDQRKISTTYIEDDLKEERLNRQ